MVSESKSEMAQDREVLGQKYDNGGVRPLRRNGTALPSASGNNTEERQGERVRRALVTR